MQARGNGYSSLVQKQKNEVQLSSTSPEVKFQNNLNQSQVQNHVSQFDQGTHANLLAKGIEKQHEKRKLNKTVIAIAGQGNPLVANPLAKANPA